VRNPSDTTSDRLAAAITVLFKAIWPIVVGLGGLTLALYQGFTGHVDSIAFGGSIVMMGFGAGGLFDAMSSVRRQS
jgi:hypothetical protein